MKKTLTAFWVAAALWISPTFANNITPLEKECSDLKNKIETIISQFELNCIDWNLRNKTNLSLYDYIISLPEFCSNNWDKNVCINFNALLEYNRIAKQKNCKINTSNK